MKKARGVRESEVVQKGNQERPVRRDSGGNRPIPAGRPTGLVGDRLAQALAGLGYPCMEAYLASPLFAAIVGRVLKTRGRRCWICHRRHQATAVHHLIYTPENLSGESTKALRQVCEICRRMAVYYRSIESTMEAAERSLAALRRSRRWPNRARKLAEIERSIERRARSIERVLDAEMRERIKRDS